MKHIFLTISLVFTCLVAAAQTGIGTPTPNKSAQLHVEATDKGVLIPQVALQSLTDNTSITNGNFNSLLVFNTTSNAIENLEPGYYYWWDTQWERLIVESDKLEVTAAMPKFFYMPTLLFDTSTLGLKTKDLHAEYISQFTGSLAKSPEAPPAIPHLPTPTDLYYYITYYDSDVIDNVSIDNNGVVNYNVKGTAGSIPI